MPSLAGLALCLALAAAGVLSHGPARPALAQEIPTDGAMAVDCNDATPDVDRECSYGEGEQFTVAVHITDSPGDGPGFQFKLRWDPAVVEYQPAERAADEADWPNCDFAARAVNAPAEPSVLLGCSIGPAPEGEQLPPAPLNGKLAHLVFRCVGGGSSPLDLVQREGDVQLGSHFLGAEQQIVDPSLTNAQVTCGGPPGPGAQQTPGQPGPAEQTATAAALAGETPGAATTGTVTGTVSPQTRIGTPTPRAGAADEDGGGGGLPVWAWIVIGVGAVAGAGGLGYLAWLRLRSPGTGAGAP